MESPVIAEAWPEPVERVSTALREAGAEARIEEFSSGTPTAEEAAGAVGCELRRIVKSLERLEAQVFERCVDAFTKDQTMQSAVAAVAKDPTFCQ